jgi:type IV pilus assembly protein PilP
MRAVDMKHTFLVFAVVAAPWALACGGDKPAAPPAPSAAAPAAVSAAPPPAAPAAASAAAGPTPKGMEYSENDFVESDSSRDPFRSYLVNPTDKKATAIANQRKVELPEYGVDELKLIGIVQSGDGNRAMLLPPTGKGTIVRKGDYVGRAEIVHVGGANGPEYPLNWRVDKIRDGDVVLIREDPNNASIPPATRVIPLHPEQDKFNAQKG